MRRSGVRASPGARVFLEIRIWMKVKDYRKLSEIDVYRHQTTKKQRCLLKNVNKRRTNFTVLFLPESPWGKLTIYYKGTGSTETWTRIAGFRVQSANHYTIDPLREKSYINHWSSLLCITLHNLEKILTPKSVHEVDFLFLKRKEHILS